LGGAPFNVAWHLAGFGFDPLLISRVGADERGAAIRDRMRAWGMDDRGLQTSLRADTGRVNVTFCDGEPHYDIVADRAFDGIAWEPLAEMPDSRPPALLVHGTLAARSEVSADTLRRLIDSKIPAFVDVNLRDPWWDREGLAAMLARAKWAKLNAVELRVLEPDGSPAEAAAALGRRFGLTWVIVTRGGDGALLWTADGAELEMAPPAKIEVVDTVGAGDAFSAVCVAGLLAGWDEDETLRRAAEFAAEVCGQRGAVCEDGALYARLRAAWGLAEGGRLDG